MIYVLRAACNREPGGVRAAQAAEIMEQSETFDDWEARFLNEDFEYHAPRKPGDYKKIQESLMSKVQKYEEEVSHKEAKLI